MPMINNKYSDLFIIKQAFYENVCILYIISYNCIQIGIICILYTMLIFTVNTYYLHNVFGNVLLILQ